VVFRRAILAVGFIGMMMARTGLVGQPVSAEAGAVPREAVVVVSDRAPIEVGGEAAATVGKGRWFGVLRREGERLEVQVCVGTALRKGWIRARHVRVLPDDEVDLASEALEIAKALNPKVDLAAYRSRLDALIERLAASAAAGKTSRERVRRLGAHLFEREGFAPGQPNTLDAVLDQKKGNCLGLSLLYLCVARRLRMPMALVTAPKHVFLQCGKGQDRFYIETTRNGELHDGVEYLKRHLGKQQVSEAGGIHFQPLSTARVVGVLFSELGRAFRDAKRYPEAFPHYARAVEINPCHAEAHVGLGATLIGMGDNAAACEPCARAARLNPGDPEAYCYWGVALRRLGRHAEACAKYARAVALRPGFDKAYTNWGVALERMGNYSLACEKHAKATRLNSRNQDAYYNWGVALAHLGRYVEACEKFARAVKLAPRDPSAHFYWGVSLHQLGENEAACEKFAKTVEIAPRFADAYRAWAAALAKMGKKAEAAEKLRRADELRREGEREKGE